MSVRIYLPATLSSLAEHRDSGLVPAEVERYVAPGEDEESEYAALQAAAEASAAFGSGRRVVLVAEVDDEDAAVLLTQLVAVHADVVDQPEPGAELGWFAIQELDDLVGR